MVLVTGLFALKAFMWRGHGRARLAATVNPWEDPLDVYRIRIPAHRRAHVTAAPRITGIGWLAFDTKAASVNDTAHQVASSQRSGRRTERVTVRNRSSRARMFYLDVETQGVDPQPRHPLHAEHRASGSTCRSGARGRAGRRARRGPRSPARPARRPLGRRRA